MKKKISFIQTWFCKDSIEVVWNDGYKQRQFLLITFVFLNNSVMPIKKAFASHVHTWHTHTQNMLKVEMLVINHIRTVFVFRIKKFHLKNKEDIPRKSWILRRNSLNGPISHLFDYWITFEIRNINYTFSWHNVYVERKGKTRKDDGMFSSFLIN